MASIFGTDLGESRKFMESGSFLDPIGKFLSPNTSYRLFFPQAASADGSPKIVAITVAGRQFNYDDLKVISYYFDLDKGECEVVNGRIIDKTDLATIAPIAYVLHQAELKAVTEEAIEALKRAASKTGLSVSAEQIEKIQDEKKLEYLGGEVAGTKISPTKKRAVQGVEKKCYTVAWLVPMAADGKPEFKKAKWVYMDLSRTRLGKLQGVYESPSYAPNGLNYIEVHMTYNGKDKSEAGRALTYECIASNLTLAERFPDEWEAAKGDLISKLDGMGKTKEDISEWMSTSIGAVNNRYTVQEIITAFKGWASGSVTSLAALQDLDKSMIESSAQNILDLGIVENLPAIKTFMEGVAAEYANSENKEEDDTPAEETKETAKGKKGTKINSGKENMKSTVADSVKSDGDITGIKASEISDDDDELGDV